MTVWSVSPFHSELDVLEIRLATLDPYVDRFVLAEATVDQRGNPKKVTLETLQRIIDGDHTLLQGVNWQGFAPYLDKITIVIVDDMPDRQTAGTEAHWERENFQRNALIRGMADLHEDDHVLICDLDEIPHPDAMDEALNGGAPLRFPMDMHVYRLNWRWTERPVTDGSTAVVQPGHAFFSSTGEVAPVHDMLLKVAANWRVDENQLARSSGWHLAYQGDAATIAAKTRSIADDAWVQLIHDDVKGQRTQDEWFGAEWAAQCIRTGSDIYGRAHRQAEWVDLDQLPPYVAEHLDRFAHLIAPWPDSVGGHGGPFTPRLCTECRARLALDTASYCWSCIAAIRGIPA